MRLPSAGAVRIPRTNVVRVPFGRVPTAPGVGVPAPRLDAPVAPAAPGRPATAPPLATNPWLPTAPCSPRACVQSRGPRAVWPLAVLRVVTVTVLVALGVALTSLVGRAPVARRDRLVRAWCRAIVRSAGVRVRITGAAPPSGGLLLVANHISWLDIPLLAAVRPARMLAKTEVRAWPVAGPAAARGGTLFIERDRLRALPDTVATIADALRAGAAVAVFPEGSTWCGRAQGHFRRAVFQAAIDAGVPVQPVRVHYRSVDGAASTVPAFVGDDSLVASLWRVASARGLVAEVEVRSTLGARCHEDRRALAHAAQQEASDTGTDHGGLWPEAVTHP